MPDQIREGQAVVKKQETPSKLVKFVTIKQDNTCFHSKYEESPNGVYLVAFADGYSERSKDEERWVDGQVCLVKEQKTILWSKRLKRPDDCVVSNNGRVAINDGLNTKLGAPEGNFLVFDQGGKLFVERKFDSNLATCAISQDGNYAAVSTAFPDNSIYLFDIEKLVLKWRFENLVRKVALGLSFSENDKILVYTGGSIASRKYDYSLTLDGKLSEESAREFGELEQITKSATEESLVTLIAFLRSSDSSKILKGLNAVQSLLYKKDRKARHQEIIPYLSPLIESSDSEISKLTVKLILQAGRKSPESIENIVPKIVKKCKEWLAIRFEGEHGLMTLGELGALNPNWTKEVVPLIVDRLENSLVWNERRFAAFAVGQIGKVAPDLVKNVIPILARYLGRSDWWIPQIRKAEQQTVDVNGIKVSVSLSEGPDPEVWVRDAALGALGDIGEKSPEAIEDTIPMIVLCLQRPEPYTRKKAVVALGQVGKKGRIYVDSAIPTLEKIAENDPDEKVRSETKRVLEIISSQ